MARYKDIEDQQDFFIPVCLEDQLIPETIEYTIKYIIDNHIDLSVFDSYYKNSLHGAKAYPPGILLKVILLGYSKGLFSSRDIEAACKTNIQFMAISGCMTPDHSTIAAFVTRLEGEVKSIFIDILLYCSQLDLIGGEVFALDGCKISSNAAKEWSGTFAELQRKKEKLKKVLEDIINRHIDNDKKDSVSLTKQIAKYEAKIKKIETFLHTNEPKKGARGRELKSNITDNESAKMPSSKGVIQGYNGLAVVDDKNQIIISAEAFGQGQEGGLLKQMVKETETILSDIELKDNLEETVLLADTNYFSETNAEYLEDMKIDGYIPDTQFRNRDPRFPENYPRRKDTRKNLFSHDDFTYNAKDNNYTCPAGKRLGNQGRKNMHGHIGCAYRAKKADCEYCHLRTKCLKKNAKARALFIVYIPKPKTYSERMMEKIDSPHGRAMYSRRMGIVEPVFANIRVHKQLDKFTLRGKEKVNIQWILYCCIHNIGKIARYIISMLLFHKKGMVLDL